MNVKRGCLNVLVGGVIVLSSVGFVMDRYTKSEDSNAPKAHIHGFVTRVSGEGYKEGRWKGWHREFVPAGYNVTIDDGLQQYHIYFDDERMDHTVKPGSTVDVIAREKPLIPHTYLGISIDDHIK